MIDSAAYGDPALLALVELAETRFSGHSGRGEVTAVVDATLTVLSVSNDGGLSDPSLLGIAAAEALNEALGVARSTVEEHLKADPQLSASLTPPENDTTIPGLALPEAGFDRDFTGSAAGDSVMVHVHGNTRLVASVYVERADEECLNALPTAANRALAAAELGQNGATPLSETIDQRLAQLDEAMSATERKLDGLNDELDTILRNLG